MFLSYIGTQTHNVHKIYIVVFILILFELIIVFQLKEIMI